MGKSARSSSASAPRSAPNMPASAYLRKTCATSTSSRCGACNVSPSAKSRSATPTSDRGAEQHLDQRGRVDDNQRPSRSARTALAGESVGRTEARRVKASAQLRDRRAFRNVSDLAHEVIGQRHTGQRSPGLQLAMEVVRNVAQLDHRRHVISIQACAKHVNTANCLIKKSE